MKKSSVVWLTITAVFISVFFTFQGARYVLYSIVLIFTVGKIYTNQIKNKIEVKRVLSSNRLFWGDREQVIVEIYNHSFIPALFLLIEDFVDFHLSYKQRFSFLTFVPPKGVKRFSYEIRGSKRGEYFLGPSRVSSSDFLGFFTWKKELRNKTPVVVYPQILITTAQARSTMQPFGEIKNPMPMFEDVSRIAGVREYRRGDELRRINWKLTAKHRKMMVNYFTPSISSGTMVFLNLYDGDYEFRYREAFQEFAIESAATIIYDLFKYKQEVGLVVNGEIARKSEIDGMAEEIEKGIIVIEQGKGPRHFVRILEVLARVKGQKEVDFTKTFREETTKLPWGTAVVSITPALTDEVVNFLLLMRENGHDVFVFVPSPVFKIYEGSELKTVGIKVFPIRRGEGTMEVIT